MEEESGKFLKRVLEDLNIKVGTKGKSRKRVKKKGKWHEKAGAF